MFKKKFSFPDPSNIFGSFENITGSSDYNDWLKFFGNTIQKYQYFRCCDESYVTDSQNDICHDQAVISKYYNLTEFFGTFNPQADWDLVKQNFKCVDIQSFFTYDELYGLNINLLWLFLTALLFVGVLILIETGVWQRLWNSSPKKVIEKLHENCLPRFFQFLCLKIE